jgi:hypothetical protein
LLIAGPQVSEDQCTRPNSAICTRAVLRPSLNLLANCRKVVPVSFSRHDILHIIALLIRNAAPSSDLRVRRKREAKSVALWIALFQVIPARFGGVTLEDLSSRWPNALRRRFASAMLHRTRKRWPYSPWGPGHDSGIRFKLSTWTLRAYTN